MIKATELRIGNWVDGGYNDRLYYRIKEHDFLNTDFAITKPIPLTEEILLKCGFDFFNTCLYHPVIKHQYQFRFYENDLYYGFYGECEFIKETQQPIKYLHQLQNLFYSLTGEELNVEL